MQQAEITISRPDKSDSQKLRQFYTLAITDAYRSEGGDVSHRAEMLGDIESQMVNIEKDFASNGQDEYTLVAKMGSEIVGTMAYGKPNKDIVENYEIDVENVPEIKSAYVLPGFHGKGIGTRLFGEIKEVLAGMGVREFCLDSGYKKAQAFWTHKLGTPVKTVQDYFAKDSHLMIWHCKI